MDFIQEASVETAPWCCFVSVTEPHDPFVCSEATYRLYDPEKMELPPNVNDPLLDRQGLYRKVARMTSSMTDREKQEAMACYYASITEIDEQFGRILQLLEQSNQLDNTIIVFTSDHGELLGAHGLYTKNISGFEEVYHIPLIMSGPGIRKGIKSEARVGLHDLCPTLLELFGESTFGTSDSQSFAPVLRMPGQEPDFQHGFAEYYGGRIWLTQRIVWQGPWKLVFNGFDFDELYHLEEDPYEMNNLIDQAQYQDTVARLYRQMWDQVKATGDHSLQQLDYPGVRAALIGPEN